MSIIIVIIVIVVTIIIIVVITIIFHCIISHCIPSYPMISRKRPATDGVVLPACRKTRPSRPKRSKLGVAIRPWADSAG